MQSIVSCHMPDRRDTKARAHSSHMSEQPVLFLQLARCPLHLWGLQVCFARWPFKFHSVSAPSSVFPMLLKQIPTKLTASKYHTFVLLQFWKSRVQKEWKGVRVKGPEKPASFFSHRGCSIPYPCYISPSSVLLNTRCLLHKGTLGTAFSPTLMI
jgi:hypothetical protein